MIFLWSFNGDIDPPPFPPPPSQIMLTIEIRMVITFRARNPTSFKYMSFWYSFLEPRQTMYHSNIGALKIRVTKRGLCTLRNPPPSPPPHPPHPIPHKKKNKYSRGTYVRSRPHQQSVGYWNVNQVEIESRSDWTNSVMTHVPLLSAKVGRNEWLW